MQEGIKMGGSQPKAVPAWYAVKYRMMESLFASQDNLKLYRTRANPKYLEAFAANVVDLYIQLEPKIAKMKNKDDYKHLGSIIGYCRNIRVKGKTMNEIDDYYFKFLGWFFELQGILEELGVINITFGEETDPENAWMEGL